MPGNKRVKPDDDPNSTTYANGQLATSSATDEDILYAFRALRVSDAGVWRAAFQGTKADLATLQARTSISTQRSDFSPKAYTGPVKAAVDAYVSGYLAAHPGRKVTNPWPSDR